MLSVLPPSLAEHYSCESKVVRSEICKSQRDVFRRLGYTVGGSHREYLKYLNRADVTPFWTFLCAEDVKAMAAFKCVLKSNGVNLRKILATLEANFLFSPPPRSQNLGLWGGAALSSVILEHDEAFTSSFDQEACFSYIEVPNWWVPYQCCAPVRHGDIGGSERTGLCLGDDHLVFPAYKRLPMGSTHSVDVMISINNWIAGQCLISSSMLHKCAVVSSCSLKIMKNPSQGFGLSLSLFTGSQRWLAAMENVGWGSITAVDTESDPNLDVTNTLFLEKLYLLLAANLIASFHVGSPFSCSASAEKSSKTYSMFQIAVKLIDFAHQRGIAVSMSA